MDQVSTDWDGIVSLIIEILVRFQNSSSAFD